MCVVPEEGEAVSYSRHKLDPSLQDLCLQKLGLPYRILPEQARCTYYRHFMYPCNSSMRTSTEGFLLNGFYSSSLIPCMGGMRVSNVVIKKIGAAVCKRNSDWRGMLFKNLPGTLVLLRSSCCGCVFVTAVVFVEFVVCRVCCLYCCGRMSVSLRMCGCVLLRLCECSFLRLYGCCDGCTFVVAVVHVLLRLWACCCIRGILLFRSLTNML